MNRRDALLHGRTRNVALIDGFQGLLRRRDVATRLSLINDFCKRKPQTTVRVRLNDFIYNSRDPVAFICTGMLLRKALRGDRKFNFNNDKKALQELCGGRAIAGLDVPKMKLAPAWNKQFEGMRKFESRVANLLSKGDPDMKMIVEAYQEDRGWLYDDVLRQFTQDI
jgi:hypothetical protein